MPGRKPLGLGASRSGGTPWKAVCGLIIIGLPCLCYACLGRTTLKKPEPVEDEDWDADDNEHR